MNFVMMNRNFGNFAIREATPNDCSSFRQMLQEMIAFHKDDCSGITSEDLIRDCFGDDPWCYLLIAEEKTDQPSPTRPNGSPVTDTTRQAIGYALYYHGYKSHTGRMLVLVDLYIVQHKRGQGIGKAFLVELGKIGVEKGCRSISLEAGVWNQNALDFYEHLGAKILDNIKIVSLRYDSFPKTST